MLGRIRFSPLTSSRIGLDAFVNGFLCSRHGFSMHAAKRGPNSSDVKNDDKKLLRELCQKIRFSGPITIAEYMREVLTNPVQGVYMKKNALGAEGHFITSPEISQMFGECLGIWLLHEWIKMGSPAPFNFVELGPGKGTLCNDIFRTIKKLRPDILPQINIHLVEVSEEMRDLQLEMLAAPGARKSESNSIKSKYGCEVRWHDSLRSVPRTFSLFVGHEFLDALPVHKFVKSKEGWREVLVDIDTQSEEPKLRYIISRNETPSCVLIDPFLTNRELELCPQAGIITKQISERLVEQGGICLLADYGDDTSGFKDTFRAFRSHKQVDPLALPGTADLTADVDFKYLESQISKDCAWFGPISQSQFLHCVGIGTRCEQLVKGGQNVSTILQAYQTLTADDKMGKRFKFAAMFPKTMEGIHQSDPPVGFHHKYVLDNINDSNKNDNDIKNENDSNKNDNDSNKNDNDSKKNDDNNKSDDTR